MQQAHFKLAGITALVLFYPAVSAAAVTTFINRADFNAAAGSTGLETFNSIAVETEFRTAPLDIGRFTLSMDGSGLGDRNNIDLPSFQFDEFNVDGTTIANIYTGPGVNILFSFDAPITAFGADFASFNDDLQRTTILAAGSTLTPSVESGTAVRFFGFVSDVPFTTVELRGGVGDGYGVDNVAFSIQTLAAPEPPTLIMFGLGALGFAGAALRRFARVA